MVCVRPRERRCAEDSADSQVLQWQPKHVGVSGLTAELALITRETVPTPTPACFGYVSDSCFRHVILHSLGTKCCFF